MSKRLDSSRKPNPNQTIESLIVTIVDLLNNNPNSPQIDQIVLQKFGELVKCDNFYNFPSNLIAKWCRLKKGMNIEVARIFLEKLAKRGGNALSSVISVLSISPDDPKSVEYVLSVLNKNLFKSFSQLTPINELRNTNESLRLELLGKNEIISEMKKKFVTTENDIRQSKSNMDKLMTENKQLKDQIVALNNQLTQVKKENTSLNTQIKDEQSKNLNLTKLIKEKDTQLLKAQDRIKELEALIFPQPPIPKPPIPKPKNRKTINKSDNEFMGIISWIIVTKEIPIKCSSDKYSFCNEVFNENNKSWVSKNVPKSWIQFDFQNNPVSLSGYEMTSNNGPKSWDVIGFNDGDKTCVMLDKKKRPHDFEHGQYITKYYDIEANQKFYRYIRIQQQIEGGWTNPTEICHCFTITRIEFYGQFIVE